MKSSIHDLSKLNPEELVKAYLLAKGATESEFAAIPEHAVNEAIGAIEECCDFLDIEAYEEEETEIEIV